MKDRVSGEPPDDPVRALRALRDDTLYALEDRKLYPIGAADYAAIVIDDDSVSSVHCMLWTASSHVYIEDADSKNGTLVNGVRIHGRVELRTADVITIGSVDLQACGELGREEKIRLTCVDFDEGMRQAEKLYGSQSSASKALGIARRTFAHWLRVGRFKPDQD